MLPAQTGRNRLPRSRHAIAEINPNILVNSVSSLEEQVDRSIATQSLIAQLSAFFGILAVFLACIGIYGLLSYSVARRTSEFGDPPRARSAIAFAALDDPARMHSSAGSRTCDRHPRRPEFNARILKSLLYQLSPLDPTAIAIAIAAVACITVAAGWLPARRASKINPMQALRTE